MGTEYKTLAALERVVIARKQDAIDGVQRFAAELARDPHVLRYQGATALEHAATIEICDALLAVIDETSRTTTPRTGVAYVSDWLRDRLISLARDGASHSTNPLANVHQAAMTALVAFFFDRMPKEQR